MQLIPVLDILNGVVVRGVAGRRDQYCPVESCLTTSVQALDMARAIRREYGWIEFYVADLDAILHGRTNVELYQDLIADGLRLSIDAGISTVPRVSELLAMGASRVIVGLESCPTPAALREIVASVPSGQIVFSLDLKGGVPLASSAWGIDPYTIAAEAIRCGVTQLIVLDLAGVGTGTGVPTIPLCQHLRATYGTAIDIVTGGGVRGTEDLELLRQSGIDGVLLASVLHQSGFQLDEEWSAS
jgi:HisA/HisF family protein